MTSEVRGMPTDLANSHLVSAQPRTELRDFPPYHSQHLVVGHGLMIGDWHWGKYANTEVNTKYLDGITRHGYNGEDLHPMHFDVSTEAG